MQNRAKTDLIYAELTEKVIGILFEVYNTLGHGHPEKTYQRAIAVALGEANLSFIEQLYVPVIFKGKVVGKNYLDFLIEDKLVLEIKKGDYFVKAHIDQVYQYLVSKNLKLGLLAYFAPKSVHFKRIVNLPDIRISVPIRNPQS
jgi:GxxExxY protein